MTSPLLKVLSAGAFKDRPSVSPSLKTFSAGLRKYLSVKTPALKVFSAGLQKYLSIKTPSLKTLSVGVRKTRPDPGEVVADISQDTYYKGRRIRKILFQQKRGHGDWEVNELQDLWLGFINDIQRLTGGFGPVGDGLMVESTGFPNELSVRRGVMVVDDTIVFLDQDTVISGLTTPVGLRTDYVYALISRSQKDETDFPDIVNPVTGEVWALRYAYDIALAFSENHPSSPPIVPAGSMSVELARLDRTPNPIISSLEIIDSRPLHARTYHTPVVGSMGRVTDAGGLTVDVEAAEGRVEDVDFTVSASSGIALADDSTTYIYIESSGPSRVFTTTVPLEIVAPEAVVVTAGGVISSITDKRLFRSQDQHAMRLEDLEAASGGVIAEITAARGTEASLDDRLDTSLEEDGSLKRVVDASKITLLFPHEQAVPDMTVYVEPGEASYGDSQLVFAGGSSPAFTAPIINDRIDLLYLDDTGVLAIVQGIEAVSPTPPSHQNKLPIAEIYLTPATTTITDALITDVRPILNLGGAGTSFGDVYSRLQLVIDGSVFERAIIDPLLDDADLGGASDGTLLEPSNYELDVGEILETNFASSPIGAPLVINQVGIVILAKQELGPTDLQVRVDRGGGYETVTPFSGTDGTHVFTGGGTNVLNLEVTNTSGGTINIEGYGLAFENSGGASGEVLAYSGIHQDSSGFELYNTNCAAFKASAADFAFTWDAVNDQLSWGADTGLGDDLEIEITSATSGTFTQTLLLTDSPLSGVTTGSYVYFDVDRVSPNVTLQVSTAGPPDMRVVDRFILGRRKADPNGGNDVFCLFNDHVVRDITSNPEVVNGVGYPPTLPTSALINYVEITGHSIEAITHSQNVAGNATYTYTIAGFQGVGLNPSKIRGLWITYAVSSDADQVDIMAHFPDGVLKILGLLDTVAVGDDRHQASTTLIPVNEGQVSLDIQLRRIGGAGSGGVSYTLVGAWVVG